MIIGYLPSLFGKQIRFELVELIEKSINGYIFKAYDRSGDQFIILKTVLFDSPSMMLNSAGFIERWERMCKYARHLKHSNVTRFVDGGIDYENGRLFYMRQYVPGYSLRDRDFVNTMNLNDKLLIMIDITDALQYAHSNKIIHRDLKPANILVNYSKKAYLSDFASARFEETVITKTGFTLGTPEYMSPEQITGKKIDYRSDIFSLGIVFYYLLTSKSPFSGSSSIEISSKIVHEKPVAPEKIVPDLPRELTRVIMRMLEKDPQVRLPGTNDILNTLEQILAKRRSGIKIDSNSINRGR